MTTVLIVEDEPAEREALERLFEDAGFATFAVDDAASALVLMNHLQVDLVFLDLILPGMSGLELLRRIRADMTLLQCRVVVYTALTDALTKSEALAGSADLVLHKPLAFEEILAAIAPLLPRRT
jgi:DNA-binding response OmpR family regulator